MSELTLDEAIKHCLEVAEKNDGEAEVYDLLAKNHNNPYEKLTASRFHADCAECAADHRQLAEWLQELKQLKAIIAGYGDVNMQKLEMVLAMIRIGSENAWEKIEREKELKEAKRLLKAAVDDFAKFDRENAKNKNCMMPEMDCADCPLSWDSVDERVEPCHNWRYANEALKLIES